MAQGKGRSSEQGVKLLYIRDYLHKYSNKEHPKSAKDIIEYLASKGIKAERKTIYNDIFRLQKDFQEPIEYNPKKWGYYIKEPKFSVYELQILMDCIRTANFLTTEDVVRISKKIAELGSVYDYEKIRNMEYFGDDPIRPINSELYNVDLIQQAIEANKRISFRYYLYYPTYSNRSSNGKMYIKSYTDNEIHVVSPKELVRYNGHYILVCYRPDSKIKHITYPVQFLESIVVLSSERECIDVKYIPVETELEPVVEEQPSTPTKEELFTNLINALVEIRDTLISIKEKIIEKECTSSSKFAVTLIFKKEDAVLILNEFGYDTPLVPLKDKYCTATIRISLQPQFFNWLFLNRTKVMISTPSHAITAYRKYVEAILQHYDIWEMAPDELAKEVNKLLNRGDADNQGIHLLKKIFSNNGKM